MSEYSEHTLRNPTLLPAVMYCRCTHCNYVDNELDFRKTRVCPHCGQTGTRMLFQKYSIQYFLELIQRLYMKDEPQAIVLVVCGMLERLLEDLLIEIMRKHKLDDATIDERLVKAWRLEDRVKGLFKEYSMSTLPQVIETLSIKDFWETWKDLKEKRDQFMHGKPAAMKNSDGKKAFELALDAQYVFAQIHNKYCLLQ
jgi:hypothetical protein